MDPCPFLRILIGGLAIKLPHSSNSQYFCKIKLKNFPTQSIAIPIIPQENDEQIPNLPLACFNLNKPQLDKLVLKSPKNLRPSCLKLEIFTGSRGKVCGIKSGKLVGSVLVPLDLKTGQKRSQVLKSGWIEIGVKRSSAQVHINVKAEPDPRFVFQFDGEPECSPQVSQVNGNLRQPVFTCKFSFRSDPNLGSRSSLTEDSTSKGWLSSFKGITREQSINERKGWSITIHDLSGSPVAAASMVTPFVPSPGTDRVSKSNPGAWLVLRPGDGTWKPWGRLEAWLEPGRHQHLGYRFDLLPDAVAGGDGSAVTLASSTINTISGGKFSIDVSSGVSPASSRSSSCDFGSGSGTLSGFGSGSWADFLYQGFVMSSTVEGEGMRGRLEVEVGVDHVTCAEDAASFVALAAAMELSVDACRPFNRRLPKKLRRQQSQDFGL